MASNGALLTTLQILEKGTNSIPVAGGIVSSIFGIASVITEKVQALKKCPQNLRDLARDVQELLLTLDTYFRDNVCTVTESHEFISCLFEIEQCVLVSLVTPKMIYLSGFFSLYEPYSRSSQISLNGCTSRS